MKLKDFLNITEKYANEWWNDLPEYQRYPYHKTKWNDFTDEMKYTIYGLWIDSLRGHDVFYYSRISKITIQGDKNGCRKS